jgi:undecaprenyl-phosphate 4-deoxy-4-formamido-L-arabinose transferase
MLLSIVIPLYESELSIEELVKEIHHGLSHIDFELILINDGSKDKTESIALQLAQKHSHIQFISLRKNFGEHHAVMCGLNHSSGEFVLLMDDDLQNPVSEIQTLLNEISKGFDVVYSKYSKKEHTIIRNIGSWLNSLVLGLLIQKPKNLYLSSFKIMRNDLVTELIKYKGPFPYLDGLILRCTNHIGVVETKHLPRKYGKSNYNFSKLVSLYLNMLVNFSIRPLRIFTLMGFMIFLCGLILSGIFIYQKLNGFEPQGWTSTVIFILLLSGFQIIFLGLISEYLGKLYLDYNQTPQYVIKTHFQQKAG